MRSPRPPTGSCGPPSGSARRPSSPSPPGCSRSSAWWPADPAPRCSRSGGPGLAGLITTFGKPVVDRTIGHHDTLAFPSGHTGGATSLSLVCALLVASALGLRARGTAVLAATSALVAGGLVGTGMIVGGAHYPTDVVGGFCAGVAAVLGVALVLDAVTLRRRVAAR
jgi:membrane-associated phospholipid phosphatase